VFIKDALTSVPAVMGRIFFMDWWGWWWASVGISGDWSVHSTYPPSLYKFLPGDKPLQGWIGMRTKLYPSAVV